MRSLAVRFFGNIAPSFPCKPLTCLLFTLSGLLSHALEEEISSIAMADTLPAILDADLNDADSNTQRHGLATDVTVTISRNFLLEPGFRATYFLIYRIENSAGDPVKLAPGGVYEKATEPFSVDLTFIPSKQQELVLYPDPGSTLDPTETYRVTVDLIRETPDTLVDQDSTPLINILHFTNKTSGDAEWNIRGIMPTLRWEQKFMVDSDPENNAFLVDLEVAYGRYDDFRDPIGNVNTSITADFDLLDSDGNSVPLADDGIVITRWTADSYENSSGRPLPFPNTIELNDYELRPLEQLDCVNNTYRLRCSIRHIEDENGTIFTDAQHTLPAETLLHFNGNLLWGSFLTTFEGLTDVPLPNAVIPPTHIDTSLVISSGKGILPGNAAHAFGDGLTPLDVELQPDGNAEVVPPQSLSVFPAGDPGGIAEQALGGTKVTYPTGVTLRSPNGPEAPRIRIHLPQGLGYIRDYPGSPHRGEGTYLGVGPFPLTASLKPTEDLDFNLPPDAAIFDESHPLVFRTGHFILTLDGALVFDTHNANYIHDEALNLLEGLDDGVLEDPVTMRERLSNDQYLRKIQVPAGSVHKWTTAPDKSARLTGEIKVKSHDFKAHFPVNTRIRFSNDSLLAYSNGQPVSAVSGLTNAVSVEVPYSQDCPHPDDPCPGNGEVLVELKPDGDLLTQTPSGGLWRKGSVADVALKWGARGDGNGNVVNPAHETDSFNAGTFFMPGYQLYAEDNPVLNHQVFGKDGGAHAPGALLLAGFNEEPDNPGNFHPTSDKYVRGDGSYGGLNFMVTAPGFKGLSRLGGDPTGFAYELLETNNSSKYYIRMGGVSGRHVARNGTWNDPVAIYGFDFDFTSYQLAMIDSHLNNPEGSWVNGGIKVSGYSNFSQGFTGLTMNCLGELTGADIDPNDVGDKNLTYWNSVFQPRFVSFSTQVNNPGQCPLEFTAVLVMGIQTEVAHIPTTLHGVFGFWPDGNLATPADNFKSNNATGDPITSELSLPAQVKLEGPKKLEGPNQDYNLVPTGKLRFNNPVSSGHATNTTSGFVTWGATLDVPYFEDFQLQCITSAPPTPGAPFSLTPGWDEDGQTFFTSSGFDPEHKSWPVNNGDGVSLNDYRNPTPTTPDPYLISARQDMFGKVPLHYKMQWDDNLRRFKSMKTQTDDIFVVEVEHEIPYLDAKFVQIDFGVKYDGLPELNITNMLNDQIDGAADSLTASITAPLKGTIDEAFERFDEMLSDTMSDAIDPIIDRIGELVIDPLYADLSESYADAGLLEAWSGAGGALETTIDDYLVGTGSHLGSKLQEISAVATGTLNDASSLVNRLQDATGKMIIGIDTIANRVAFDQGAPQLNLNLEDLPQINLDPENLDPDPSGVLSGWLHNENEEYQIITRIIEQFLQDLPEPDVAAVITPLLQNATSELNTQLNGLLAEAAPALEQAADALNQVREFLVQIHQSLDDAGSLINQIQDVVDEASTAGGELETILLEVADRAKRKIQGVIDSVGVTGDVEDYFNIFDEISQEEFRISLKTDIKDLVLGSDMLDAIKHLARQNLQDLEIKFRSTIQSVLNQVSEIVKEVVSSTIGSLEKNFAPMLGKIDQYLGAAEITGFAEFNGDSLRKLRMDLMSEISLPDPMQIHLYLEILATTSEDNFTGNACLTPGDKAVEVRLGAMDTPLDWIGEGLTGNLEVKMSLKDDEDGLVPNGVGGSLELTGGTIDFQAVRINCFAAAISVGLEECYIGAKACATFSDYELSAGIFFGKTCTLDPLYLVDSDVAELIDLGTPFTGAYVYGEVWLPISEIILGVPASCVFRVSAGVGVGCGFSIEGPTFIAKMLLGVSGEALCVVSFEGIIKMVGVIQNGRFKASGSGSFGACVGFAFIKICFNATIKMEYDDGTWSVDY